MKNWHTFTLYMQYFQLHSKNFNATQKCWLLILAGCRYICCPTKFHLQPCQTYVWPPKSVIITFYTRDNSPVSHHAGIILSSIIDKAKEKLVRVKGSKIVLNITEWYLSLYLVVFYSESIKYRKFLYLFIWNEIQQGLIIGPIVHWSPIFRGGQTHCCEPEWSICKPVAIFWLLIRKSLHFLIRSM